jgi:hypothetical protein
MTFRVSHKTTRNLKSNVGGPYLQIAGVAQLVEL